MSLQQAEQPDILSLGLWPSLPHTLRHLTRPVPQDVPAHLDSGIFTFEDAFEDLLAVSQGQQLPDIKMKHDQRSLLRRVFPDGEPMAFWAQRLMSQRLVERKIDIPNLFSGLVSALDHDASQLASRLASQMEVWDRDAPSESAWDRFMAQFGATSDRTTRSTWRSDVDPQRREPDHFEDLFSEIESAVASGNSSWDTFVKSLSQDRDVVPEGQTKRLGEEPGCRKEVKHTEYVDEDGYINKHVTVRFVDAQGNPTGREYVYQTRRLQR